MESRKDIDLNTLKKVLFLTNIPSPYRVEFFGELGKYCDLTVLYERRKADDREWKYVEKTNYTSVFLKGIKKGADNALCFEVLQYLKKEYDVIIVGGYSTPTGMLAIEYLKLKKIPFYMNCDGGFVRQEKKINYWVKKHFIKSATYWLSSGSETNKYLEHYGAKKERIFNYPFSSVRDEDVLDGVLSREDKEQYRKELDITEEKVVVSVGQFIHRKGFDVLIKGSAKFSENVGVYIVGGKPTEEYVNLSEAYGANRVHFVGFCDKETLKKYYKSADCMVFPTREDIWGLVINEALACGLPIVSTDKCVAALELVGKAGYIIPSDNVDALCEKTIEILAHPELQRQMSLDACKTARKYTIETMAKAHVDIFDKNM